MFWLQIHYSYLSGYHLSVFTKTLLERQSPWARYHLVQNRKDGSVWGYGQSEVGRTYTPNANESMLLDCLQIGAYIQGHQNHPAQSELTPD